MTPDIADLRAPAPITPEHDLSHFACGEATIDDFLRKQALVNHKRKFSMVFVLADSAKVVWGYYALALAEIERTSMPRKQRHGAPSRVAVVLLGRLGVDARLKGHGIGDNLFADAVRRAAALVEHVPVPLMAVHALNEDLVPFYTARKFTAFNREKPCELVRPMSEIEAEIAAAREEAEAAT